MTAAVGVATTVATTVGVGTRFAAHERTAWLVIVLLRSADCEVGLTGTRSAVHHTAGAAARCVSCWDRV